MFHEIDDPYTDDDDDADDNDDDDDVVMLSDDSPVKQSPQKTISTAAAAVAVKLELESDVVVAVDLNDKSDKVIPVEVVATAIIAEDVGTKSMESIVASDAIGIEEQKQIAKVLEANEENGMITDILSNTTPSTNVEITAKITEILKPVAGPPQASAATAITTAETTKPKHTDVCISVANILADFTATDDSVSETQSSTASIAAALNAKQPVAATVVLDDSVDDVTNSGKTTLSPSVDQSVDDQTTTTATSTQSMAKKEPMSVDASLPTAAAAAVSAATTPPSRTNITQKRRRSPSPIAAAETHPDNDDDTTTANNATDTQPPAAKRVCTELRQRSARNNDSRSLLEYIDRSAAVHSTDEVQRHIEQLRSDIDILDEMSAAKEAEWNNILHLKRCKEEIVVRLLRRQAVLQIMAQRLDEDQPGAVANNAGGILVGDAATAGADATGVSDLVLTNGMQAAIAQLGNASGSNASVAVAASSAATAAAATQLSNAGSTTTSAAAILANRANMKSSDLAKEKATTARLHRYGGFLCIMDFFILLCPCFTILPPGYELQLCSGIDIDSHSWAIIVICYRRSTVIDSFY